MTSKTIRISNEIYERLLLRKADLALEEFIKDLIATYDSKKVTLKYVDRMTFLDYGVSIGCEKPEEIPPFDFFFCGIGKETPYTTVTGVTKVTRISEILYELLKKARIHPEETFSSVLFRLLTFQDDLIMLSAEVQEMLFRREFILYPELFNRDPTLAAQKVVTWLLSCSNSNYAGGYKENQKMLPTEITTVAKRKLEALSNKENIPIDEYLFFLLSNSSHELKEIEKAKRKAKIKKTKEN